MSPILDVQRRLAEAGRIRAGHQVATGGTRKDGKPSKRPVKLTAWRFTSRNQRALEAVAELYGGEVKPWTDAPTGDQFELFSEAPEIDVVLPPEAIAFSQWLEEWNAGGCVHRCDGVTDRITQGPCSCDPERRTCIPHTRLSVMLQGAPTTGLWRVETSGHYAKTELLGAMDLAELLTAATGRAVLPARLRLEHRKIIRDGKTKKFVVPVLDYQIDMAALALGTSPTPAALQTATALEHGADATGVPALGPGGLTRQSSGPVTPVEATAPPSVGEQIASAGQPATRPRRANAAPALPATGRRPRPANEVAAGASSPPPSSPPAASDRLGQARNHVMGRLRRALDREGVAAFETTILEEFGPADEFTLETFAKVEAWLDENLPSASSGAPVTQVESPSEAGAYREGSSPSSSVGAPDNAPGWCADLHRKKDELGLGETEFRALVGEASNGRTTSTKELGPSEAAKVMRRLMALAS